MSAIETLYHYCSTESFVSIVRSRSIWLSSLSLANDSMEGRLVNATITRLAERDGLDASARGRLQESLAFTERAFHGLGFCLSEDGDLLSQWRGYADDARGLSVGFSRAYLETLSAASLGQIASGFAMHKVDYEASQHETQLEPTYCELRKLIDAGAFTSRGLRSLLDNRKPEQIAVDDKKIEAAHSALVLRLLAVFPLLYKLKVSAFREEREWRLVSMLIGDDPSDKCLFRAANRRIIPYRAIELIPNSVPSVSEVVIGPRHETPPSVIQSMLLQAGFGRVTVRRSDATYR